MKRLFLLFLLATSLKAQFISNGGSPSSTILHIEVRDFDANETSCATNSSGWTRYTWWNSFSAAHLDSLEHCENSGYNDSAESVVINNIQYQVNCACNDANPINMFVRNYLTGAKTDSLIIYNVETGHTTHRLTLLGICKWQGTPYCLLGGFERNNHPPAITHADTLFGIYRWTPGETVAYYVYDTEASGSFGMNGLAMHGGLVYTVSERTDTLEVINPATWTQSAVKDMGQPGGTFRGIAIIGNTILVANNTDVTIDYYNLSLTYQSSRNMKDFVAAGNCLYGLWTKDEYR